MRSPLSLLVPLIFSSLASGTEWQVGPGLTYTLPSEVSGLVEDGDTVDIEAGVYPSDVAHWTANDLLLRGVGGLAHLESNGMAWGEKAIWVIQGDRTTVEWIEFSECSVPDQNGAGIRQEGRDLTVRHCYFHDNEDGILAGEIHPSTMLIEHSEFGHNGFGDGFSHNLYIGNIDTLIFRSNYSHHAHVGHELKSRAWVNLIEYNRFSNEADGDASREIDLPDGGQAYLIGNVVQQGLEGDNSNMVGFGMESFENPGSQELYAINNTLVNERANGSFFSMGGTSAFFKAYNNILAGGGSIVSGTWPTSIDTLANLRATSIASVQFADAAGYDYHIPESSPAHNLGIPAGLANSGLPLVALYEYVHPADGVLRCQHASLDAGAYEVCSTGIDATAAGGPYLFPNPTIDRLFLSESAFVHGRALIIDATGRVVATPELQAGYIDVQMLAPGLYDLLVTDGSALVRLGFVKR